MNIAIIPARSGSKGFKDKNIAKINGRTLIEYAVLSALSATKIDRIFISTDSSIYEEIALNAGAESLGLRPDFLSGDEAKSINVVVNLLEHDSLLNVEHVVLLQPTSPLRCGADIDECLTIAERTGESVVSVALIDDPHPFKLKKIVKGCLMPFIEGSSSEVNRQNLQNAFALTGGIYVAKRSQLVEGKSFFSKSTQPYIMDRFVNIDSEEDFEFLNFLIEMNKVRLVF